MKDVDGKELMCSKHEIDYRITCDECQEKYKKFSKIAREMAKSNEQHT